MPYVPPEDRHTLNFAVENLKAMDVTPNGKLNYVLFKLCKDTVEPSYNNYKNFIAELTECSEEIRRRFLSPYEDEKIKENGDV